MAKIRSIIRYTHTHDRRTARVRGKITASDLVRLSVFRSNKYIYAQLIEPKSGKTLAGLRGDTGEHVGQEIAKLAAKHKVQAIVFDRGGYRYHGQVKALAEAARAGGLQF